MKPNEEQPNVFYLHSPAAPAVSIVDSLSQVGSADLLWACFERVFAFAALFFGLPVLLAVAVIIRWDTPGNPLFSQIRIGRNGRRFRFYKFRTLYADARTRFPELYTYRYRDEEIRTLQFKKDNDPRVTPAGRWLRKSTLDELPNLINVLTGDVALVGPRPEIPEMLPYYTEAQLLKFSVRPGLTGLAQVSGRNDLTFHETIAYDLKYVRTRSLSLDLRIFAKTALCILTRRGAL